MQRSEQLLADLRKRSTSIAPLKLRRSKPNRPLTVESLCDWETDKVELLELFGGVQRPNRSQISSDLICFDHVGLCVQRGEADPEIELRLGKMGH